MNGQGEGLGGGTHSSHCIFWTQLPNINYYTIIYSNTSHYSHLLVYQSDLHRQQSFNSAQCCNLWMEGGHFSLYPEKSWCHISIYQMYCQDGIGENSCTTYRS